MTEPAAAPARPPIRISPSLLAADFSRLGEEVLDVQRSGADWIHVDVMDGHFVPNLTIGPAVIKSIRGLATVPLDVHLMIERPWDVVDAYIDAGADILTAHVEAFVPTAWRRRAPRGWTLEGYQYLDDESRRRVRDFIAAVITRDKKVGLALNPTTPASLVLEFLGEIDMIVAMTVWPGFGAQKFIDEVSAKIHELRLMSGERVSVEVDGGINMDTVGKSVAAGANVLVAGTAVFGDPEPRAAIKGLRDRAAATPRP
ncbi:MAG: ribulose-phosphate 3-epimerase [Planctomycetes bacterium]|nr:ribulose-phosphate 3-epimerase [Planctomycetota bacterium]